ncbi:MAG: hypothetical protein V7749_13630 [Cocleimonas sp.]
MKNLFKLLVLVLPIITVQACSSPVPNKTDDSSSASIMPKEFGDRFSSEKIKREREALYAKKLSELRLKDPATEVNNALRSNNIYLMAVPAGRGVSRSIPILNEPKSLQVNCKTVAVEGMGDALFGKNHILYRQELLQYMRKFNTLMSPYCK